MLSHDEIRQLRKIFVTTRKLQKIINKMARFELEQKRKFQESQKKLDEEIAIARAEKEKVNAQLNDVRADVAIELKMQRRSIDHETDNQISELGQHFNNIIDPFMEEIVATRQERILAGYKLAQIDRRLERLEAMAFSNKMPPLEGYRNPEEMNKSKNRKS